MRLPLVILLSCVGMAAASWMLYADFRRQRRETAEFSNEADLEPERKAKTSPGTDDGRNMSVDPRRSDEVCPSDVDCLLGPRLRKCSRCRASQPPLDPRPLAKLGASEISMGIGDVRTEIKKCGAGATVAIKFSVDGATGAVTSATPLDEHASTPIGKCVASAAKNAEFPNFQAQQQAFTFNFRL